MFYPFAFKTFNKMPKGFYYTVQPEDTLETISKRYKIPVNDIIMVNKLTYPYVVRQGEKIFIPGMNEPVSPQGGSIYTVKFGDDLEKIAQRYDVSVNELMKKNYITNKNVVYVGQKLLIPSKKNYSEEVEQETKTQINEDNSNETQDNSSQEEEIKVYPLGTSPYRSNMQKNNTQLPTNRFIEMEKGFKGEEVIMFKRLISGLGYRTRKMDDYFDTNLEKQVKQLQRRAGFEANGKVDYDLWEYVFSRINNTPL